MKKRKSQKRILITLIIVTIFIISILSIIYTYSLKKVRDEYGYEIMGVYKPNDIATNQTTKGISFKNMEILKSFKGELPVSTITKKIKSVFIDTIPEVITETADMDEETLKQYYSENVKYIRTRLRINNEESFLNMISKFREINCDLENDYDMCEFSSTEYVSFKFIYTNGQYITCNISGENVKTFYLEF